jgi:hypothetical protein
VHRDAGTGEIRFATSNQGVPATGVGDGNVVESLGDRCVVIFFRVRCRGNDVAVGTGRYRLRTVAGTVLSRGVVAEVTPRVVAHRGRDRLDPVSSTETYTGWSCVNTYGSLEVRHDQLMEIAVPVCSAARE